MRAVVQRVARARVTVAGEAVGAIGPGFVVLVGVGQGDQEADALYLADKIAHLRVFEDESGKLNLSIKDVGGAVLAVSQFTLWADCRKGRRPSFVNAAPGDAARPLFDRFTAALGERGIPTATGRFGAMMDVELVNQGPVTILLDSGKEFLTMTTALEGPPPCLVYADEDGTLWFTRDDARSEIFRPDILEIFFDHARLDEAGRYVVQWQNQVCQIDVADTLFVVRRLETGAEGELRITLNDGRSEALDPATLRLGTDNVIYCSVRQGAFPARFTRAAYYQLAEMIDEDDQGFWITVGGKRFPIK